MSTSAPGLHWRRLPLWAEVATIVTGYVLYEVLRALSPTHVAAAMTHAHEVIRLEHWLRIGVELGTNHTLTAHPLLASLAGGYYGTLHFIVTPVVLLLLWWRRPAAYAALRSGLVLASFAALFVFWTWPVAPPRLAVHGAVDTLVSRHLFGAANPHGVAGLIDNYAAMPSLHVGWALWCAIAIVAATRTAWRHLAWLYPIATTLVVITTANHYLLDAIAGAALIVVALGIAGVRPRVAAAPVRLPQQRPAAEPLDAVTVVDPVLLLEQGHRQHGTAAVAAAGRPAPSARVTHIDLTGLDHRQRAPSPGS